jgi:hypothetical protein
MSLMAKANAHELKKGRLIQSQGQAPIRLGRDPFSGRSDSVDPP